MVIFYYSIGGLLTIVVLEYLTIWQAKKDIKKLKKEIMSRLSLTTSEPNTSQLYRGYKLLKSSNLEEFKIAELVLKVERDIKITTLDFPLIDKLSKYFMPFISAIVTAVSISNIKKTKDFLYTNYFQILKLVKIFTPIILVILTCIFVVISVKNFSRQFKLFNERKRELISTHLMIIDCVKNEN